MKRALLFLASLAVFSAGCGREPDGKSIRFRYWGDTEEIRILGELIRDFEKAHPGVKVRDERKPAGAAQYSEILINEFAAGNPPDVIFCVAEIKDMLAERNLLESLEPFLAAEKEFKKKDFYPSLITRFSSGGELVVLPRDIAPFACVYYNKDLFKRAGAPLPRDDWSWKDLRASAAKIAALKTPSGRKIFGFCDDWTMLDAWVLSSGGSPVDSFEKPSRMTYDSEAALRGVMFRWDLIFTDRSMPGAADQQAISGGSMASFLNGELGMFYSGAWKIPEFRRIKDFDWDMAMFPKGPEGKRGFLSGGSGYAIRKGVKDPGLAWELVRFLGGPEGQKRLASTGLAQPSLMRIADSPAFLDGGKPANKKLLIEAARIGKQPPSTSQWVAIDGDVLTPVMGRIWVPGFKREDVRAVVKEANDKANQRYFGAKK